jgi:hypothetical protein
MLGVCSDKYPSIESKIFDHDNIEKLRAENF